MQKMHVAVVVALGFGGMLTSSSAFASPITETLTFNLTGFVDIVDNSTPPDPLITGSITIKYDPSLSYDDDTTDIVVNSLTGVTVSSPLGFTYQNGFLEFGGIQNDASFVDSDTNDLVVAFNVTNPSDPTFIPCSTPDENSTCIPTQIPSTGRPAATRRAIRPQPSTARNPAMHAANAPTPGTTRPSHSIARSWSAVTVTSAPARTSARSADRRFPDP